MLAKTVHLENKLEKLFIILWLQIKYINKTEIINCKHLTTLKLDGNNLLIVQDDLFEYQPSLEHLGKLN